ncbi:large ribosomal subunit protein uL3m-like [Littorina saxatilis]|uniref:Large ribosomal subunit protein uL3m n=1 Tax=Littorina saxatilis TaxID=31220 RepID=A0AAN9BWT2_9CAEN
MATVSAVTLRNALCQLQCRLTGVPQHAFGYVGLVSNYCQVRTKKQTKAQYKLEPDWFVNRKNRRQGKALTGDNEDFVQEVIGDTYRNQDSMLKEDPWPRQEYHRNTRRTGVVAIKLGVVPQWTKEGHKFFTTLLQVIDNHVIRYTPPEEFEKTSGWKPWWGQRFGSVVVGAMSSDPRNFSKAYNNLFTEAGVPPKKKLTRFLVTPDAAIQPGTPLTAMHFRAGDHVDVQAKTIDYGFQGVVKRWGMKGMPASHGVTKAHRKMGSTGGGGDKSGIWKGKKMPGHMGDKWRILKGLKIWRINTKYNVLYVQGPNIPGNTHGVVRIYDTILRYKRPAPDNHPPMPTWAEEDSQQGVELEYFDENLHVMSEASVSYSQ